MRSRVTSRRSCWGWSGTKLGVRRPCCSRSASHSASCTSVLRPGTRFRCESRDEDQFNIANQTISHRTPQNSGALHCDVGTADFDKPTFAGEVILWSSSQRYEFHSVGGKLSMMLTHATNPALMHIQSTTPSIENFHQGLSFHNTSLNNTLEDQQRVPVKDQFRLRALTAIQGGSARHLGTSLKEQALGVKFTAVLSLPLFFLFVYLVFMPGGATATHDFFGIKPPEI